MTAFTITREESQDLEKDYEIGNIVLYLHKALCYVDGNTSIYDAIKELQNKTRFKDEINDYLSAKTAYGNI